MPRLPNRCSSSRQWNTARAPMLNATRMTGQPPAQPDTSWCASSTPTSLDLRSAATQRSPSSMLSADMAAIGSAKAATSVPSAIALRNWLPASCSTLLVTMRIRAPPRPVSSSVSHTSANRLPKPLGAFTQGSKKSTGPVRSHPLTAIVTLAAPSSARVRFQGTSSRGGPFSPLHHWLTSSSLLTAWSQAAASCSAALCASRTRDLAQSSEPRST
mmetsp:Transcript_25915/g.76797  ORF Transcript_25915/g.76797 Transcript_25915/m.76797 type:complete len:215 (+) Transcript_25915:346-990(+)